MKFALVLIIVFALLSCGKDDETKKNDNPQGSLSDSDPLSESDSLGSDDEEPQNLTELPIRKPGQNILDCTEQNGIDQYEQKVGNLDFLCTFDYKDLHGIIYIQTTPTECGPYMSYQVKAERGYIKIDGKVEELQNVFYDTGFNHANDMLEFKYLGQKYTYSHSSYSDATMRTCHSMDCMKTGEINGCECERALPVTCSFVNSEGGYKELVDTFEPCFNDPFCGSSDESELPD